MGKVLVSGGCGFIGSHLVEALLKEGHEVSILDNFSTGSMENIRHLMSDEADLRVIRADVRDEIDVEDAINGSEYIFHLAAIRSVPKSLEEPRKVHEANATGTLNVLEAARKTNVKRVVFAGSSSEHGENKSGPRSPYAVSKCAGTNYCQAYYESFGLETISLRYFNVFGARQTPKSKYAAVVPIFIERIMAGLPVLIQGDGNQAKDFTHVDNVVFANMQAMKAEETHGQAVDIGCGRPTSVLALAKTIHELCGHGNLQLEFTDPRPGDVRRSQADWIDADRDIEYEPKVNFKVGIEKTIAWWQSDEGQEWLKKQAVDGGKI